MDHSTVSRIGVWMVTQGTGGEALLRGVGVATVKSATLLSVSAQPLPLRIAAVELLRFAVGAPSKQLVAAP